MNVPSEFDEIRPYNDEEVRTVIDELLHDRQFSLILKGLVPWLPEWLRNIIFRIALIGVHGTLDLQKRFMVPLVKYVLRKTSKGATFRYDEISRGAERYTFVSNHRDIVLDSAILDVMLHDNKFETTCEIAIGDNLLIHPWIKKFVKLNKAFTVKRGLGPRELQQSSQLMSQYMHYAVNEKHENIWIAQREGRAKDSNDRTQVSVLKMLAMGGDGSPVERLKDLHIVPLSISYEYDPCDYLKAQEFQQKRDDPDFKKSQQDDLNSMKTGIFGCHGHIHYEAAPCIDSWLDELTEVPRVDFYPEVARRMNLEIYKRYRLYPGNYVAFDELKKTRIYADSYSRSDKKCFDAYIDGQLKKIQLENPDEAFLRECLLTMYANPLINQLRAKEVR